MFAELIRAGLQALIEAEATEAIGTGRYQRSGERTVHRNGHRPKTVSTTAGDIEVAIPKLRAGSFFPSLLGRRRRIDRSGSSSDGSCSRACPRPLLHDIRRGPQKRDRVVAAVLSGAAE